MSSAITIAAVAAVAISAATAAYSAVSQADAADEQAKLQEEQAKQEKEYAQTEADKIRERGKRVAASQEASLAASGIKLDGQGTSSALLDETKTLAEQDALAAIKGGANRAKLLQGEASISRDKATSSLVAGGLNVGSTLIGGYNSYQKSTQGTKQADSYNMGTNTLADKYNSNKSKLTLLS